MRYYEVILDDGWKTRVPAASPEQAIEKAEKRNRGRKAVSVTPCEEPRLNEHL